MSDTKCIVGYYPPAGFLNVSDYELSDGDSENPHLVDVDVVDGLDDDIENALVDLHAKEGGQNDVLLLEIHEDGSTEHIFAEA